jgi:hypothetical protein
MGHDRHDRVWKELLGCITEKPTSNSQLTQMAKTSKSLKGSLPDRWTEPTKN